jgi:HAD superfamily hydrolase (TIGR01509 family)
MRTRVILFDLDGVLVDACEIHYKALNHALVETVGFHISRRDHEETFDGLCTRQKLSRLHKRELLSKKQMDQVYDLKQGFTQQMAREILKPDNVKIKMCQELETKYLIGCVSNCIRKSVDLLLELVGIREYMMVTVSNNDVKNPKPAGDSYLKAVELFRKRTQIDLGAFVAVEDNEKGLKAAENAGMKVIRMVYPDVNLENVTEAVEALR